MSFRPSDKSLTIRSFHFYSPADYIGFKFQTGDLLVWAETMQTFGTVKVYGDEVLIDCGEDGLDIDSLTPELIGECAVEGDLFLIRYERFSPMVMLEEEFKELLVSDASEERSDRLTAISRQVNAGLVDTWTAEVFAHKKLIPGPTTNATMTTKAQ